jgi:hypothetical protein
MMMMMIIITIITTIIITITITTTTTCDPPTCYWGRGYLAPVHHRSYLQGVGLYMEVV